MGGINGNGFEESSCSLIDLWVVRLCRQRFCASEFRGFQIGSNNLLTSGPANGRTTKGGRHSQERADAIKLLGEPTATFIPPMVKETSGEAIGYTYQAVRGGLFSGIKNSVKILRISFDDKGFVSDIDYTSSDNK
jgi:hypothetical protein